MRAGARDDDEIDHMDEFIPAMPGFDFGEGVGADEEKDAIGGVYFLQALDGVDGIAALGALFHPGDAEARLGEAGEFDHAGAVGEGRACDAGFVRWVAGGDEQNVVELEAFERGAGYGEMGVVDGVKGTTKHAEAF